jgi:hypothetical protein
VLEDDPQRGYPHYVSAWLEMRAAGSERVDISARYCELLRDESYYPRTAVQTHLVDYAVCAEKLPDVYSTP